MDILHFQNISELEKQDIYQPVGSGLPLDLEMTAQFLFLVCISCFYND